MTLIPPPEDPDVRDRGMQRFNRVGPLKGFLDVRERSTR